MCILMGSFLVVYRLFLGYAGPLFFIFVHIFFFIVEDLSFLYTSYTTFFSLK